MCWDYSPFNYSGIGGDGGASARKLFTEKLRKTAERNAHAMRPSHRQTQNCVKSNIEMRRIVIKIYSFTVFNYPDTTHTHTHTDSHEKRNRRMETKTKRSRHSQFPVCTRRTRRWRRRGRHSTKATRAAHFLLSFIHFFLF